MFGFDRITSDPNILGGKACIRGMRISVSLIVNLVANGMTIKEILDEYPDLERKMKSSAGSTNSTTPSRRKPSAGRSGRPGRV